MTLWHVSASRAITPADMATCLGLTSPAPSIPFPAPEPAAPPPAPSPAAERVRTFSASRFGLGDRSVLAGNARLMAARLRTKRADTAVGLGLSAFIGTVVFCFVMMALSIMANPILVIFWAGAMSAAAGRRCRRRCRRCVMGMDHRRNEHEGRLTPCRGQDGPRRRGT